MSSQNKMSYHCGEAKEPLEYETIGDCFDRIVESYPENEALVVCHQDIRWNYREYKDRVDELATGFLKLGIRPGDRVGIWGPNSYEWLLVQLATAKIGAIMVCINPAYRLYEIEYALNNVECRVIVSAERFKSSEYLNMLQQLAPELNHCEPGCLKSSKLPHLEMVVRMGDERTPGMLNLSEVCRLGGEGEYQKLVALKSDINPDDPINIQFTSGTTGSPKGATLTHYNILNNACLNAQAMEFGTEDRLCIPVPLYHCFGMVMGNLACIAYGATAVYPNDAFDPLVTLQVIEQERCTAVHGVPTMFIAELDHPRFTEFDLTSLRTGIMSGAPCPVEVMKRVMNDMNMKNVLIAYGQTELSPVNHLTLADDPIDKRVETVGRAVPWVEIKIVDEKGNAVPVGERGEICTRGFSVMLGYWNDAEKTRETIDEAGWLHSGDIGIMDAEGYVRIVGRIKDMIIRGGENVYPREVEEFIYTHPKVSEVAVFGVADEKMGEEICAWIQLLEGEEATEEEMKSFCQEKITYFKVPRYIRFVTEYPMTITGKIQKFKMREIMESEL